MKRRCAFLLAFTMVFGLAATWSGNVSVDAAENSRQSDSWIDGEIGVEEGYFPMLEYKFDETFKKGVAEEGIDGEDAYLSDHAVYVQDEDYGQVLYLDGSTAVGGHNSFMEFPEGIFDGMDELTVSMDVKEVTRRGNYFTFALGQDNNKYLFLKTAPTYLKLAITENSYMNESVAEKSFIYPNNSRTWIHVTMVVKSDSIRLYQDGALFAETKTDVTISDLGTDLKAYLGKSFYSGDQYFRGYFDNVTVFDYAMVDEEVEAFAAYTKRHHDKEISELEYVVDHFEIPNADDIRGNITLPTEINGVQIEWKSSDEQIVSSQARENDGYDRTPAGLVTRQQTDAIVKLTATFTKDDDSMEKSYNVTVKAQPEKMDPSQYKGYLFVRFTGSEQNSSQEQTYFSISRDGLNWQELNDGQPVLTSVLGESGLRDHYIGRSAEGDKFYMIATDLSIYHGNAVWMEAGANGSHSIVVWESEDLVNWSEPWLAEIAPDNAGCTWAPEFIYDDITGEYIVYWSATTLEVDENKNVTQEYENHTIYYAKTRDFRTFTEPEVYHSGGKRADGTPIKVIDSTMIEQDGTYYRYTKNEMNGTIMIDKADAVLGEFTQIPSDTLSSVLPSKQGAVEGPIIFKMNELNEDGEEQWCLMVDRFARGQGYYPLITTDLSSGEFELLGEDEYEFPTKYRHGYVMPITQEEYNMLQMKWGEEEYFDTYLLEEAIKEAKALEAVHYTEESYAVLAAQIQKAEAALDAIQSMEELEQELAKLQSAIDQLVAGIKEIDIIVPNKVEYFTGEELDLTGLVVTAVYYDGTIAEITDGYEVEMPDMIKPGSHTVTISYKEKQAVYTITVLENGLPYEDVAKGDWFYEAVAYTYNGGLMTGMDPTHFGPYGTLSRAQFALILHRMENEAPVETEKSFGDIVGGEWYGPAVLWAAQNGIVNGYENGCFGPADLITREQMAVMMYRYAQFLGEDVTVDGDYSHFLDAEDVSGFAEEAMKWAVGKGIITGKENGTRIDPQGSTARSEAAIIIQRFMK